MISYRASDHTYWADGKQWPGITSVLSALGYYGAGKAFYTEDSRQKGTAIHEACRLADLHCPDATRMEDVLDVLEIHEAVQPYLAGWLLFRREKGWRATAWEQPLSLKRLRIAGTPDAWGETECGSVLIDLKSWAAQGAKPKRSAEVQTAAYDLMLEESEHNERQRHRWIVKLSGDSKYRCYECGNDADYDIVSYCARVWWDQYNAGIVKMSGDPESELAIAEGA